MYELNLVGGCMKLTKQDQELIDIASKVVLENCDLYEKPNMHVGCALRVKSGKVYTGVNIKTSHSICAEQVAIGQALANGERDFDVIVSCNLSSDKKPRVVSPCGVCRYTFDKLGLNLNVIVADENGIIKKVSAEELLPYPYKREKQLR